MPQVIVPLDGSARSERALPYAQLIAAGAGLTLVTTMWGNDAAAPREYLGQRAAELVDIETEITVVGDRGPAESILLTARDHPDSIICMSTHGRSGLGEAVLGSVAEAVVRGTASHVLLVGPHATPAPTPNADIVVAVDTPRAAAALAPAAAGLASALGAGVCAIEVVSPPPIPLAPDADRLGRPEDGKGAEAAVGTLTRLGFSAEAGILQEIDPARAIVDFARNLPASFVVVGTHARQGVARVALGSVAMRVVRQAPCPVLVVNVHEQLG